MLRRSFAFGLVAAGIAAAGRSALAQGDPLPSWNDSPRKRAILDFVARTTTAGSADFVPVPERIATFDNDGTLWCEKPVYFQFMFAMDRVKALAPQHPEWKDKPPFSDVLAGNMAAIAAMGEKGVIELVMATHSGMTVTDFERAALEWVTTAKHPRFKRPYIDLVYQPMLELLALMRAKEFQTFIVSGGGIDFMRPWTDKVYGIPPQQVVGSSGVVKYDFNGGKPVLIKEPKVDFVDDGPGKPVGIYRFIGRRPVFAFGNSDGDQQMLEYTAGRNGASFMGLVHHTDAVREYAYDRDSDVGRLNKAWDEAVQRGWSVVDMKNDWKVIFPFEK